jgi:hypothetical protein
MGSKNGLLAFFGFSEIRSLNGIKTFNKFLFKKDLKIIL